MFPENPVIVEIKLHFHALQLPGLIHVLTISLDKVDRFNHVNISSHLMHLVLV